MSATAVGETPVVSEGHGPGGSVEKAYTDTMLKPGDLTADSGIRQGKDYGDARKATTLRNGGEDKRSGVDELETQLLPRAVARLLGQTASGRKGRHPGCLAASGRRSIFSNLSEAKCPT